MEETIKCIIWWFDVKNIIGIKTYCTLNSWNTEIFIINQYCFIYVYFKLIIIDNIKMCY